MSWWRGPVPPLLVFFAALAIIASHYAMTWGMYQLCVDAAKDAQLKQVNSALMRYCQPVVRRLCQTLWVEVKEARQSGTDILLAIGTGAGAAASGIAMYNRKKTPCYQRA